jgi:hypothetical protein
MKYLPYKFYKIFSNGKEKLVYQFESTLDPNYHSYINWCNENKINWKVLDFEGKIKFKSKNNYNA